MRCNEAREHARVRSNAISVTLSETSLLAAVHRHRSSAKAIY